MRHSSLWWLALVFLFFPLFTGCEKSSQQSAPTAQATSSGTAAVGGEAGNQAPDFQLKDLQGKPVSLGELRGKVVLVNFWATWCPPCREEMPSMEALHRQFKDQGLVLLAINVEEDGVEAVTEFLKGKDYTFPILFDPEAEVQSSYQVYRFPETFVIDRNGTIIDRVIGGRNWLSDAMVKRLNFLLNG